MTEKKEDRRIQRTRLTLREALVSLIREKGFEALTVQDIIDRANVGRSTFYSHFKSKEDLLAGGIEMMRSSFREIQRKAIARSTTLDDRLFAFGHELFAHVEQHRDVYAIMVGKSSGTLVRNHLHGILSDLVREDVNALAARRKLDPMHVEATVQFVAGALMGLVEAWLDQMPRLSASDVDGLFRRMAIPAVRAVLG